MTRMPFAVGVVCVCVPHWPSHCQVTCFQCGDVTTSGSTRFTCPTGSRFDDINSGSFGNKSAATFFSDWSLVCTIRYSMLQFQCSPCPNQEYSFEAGYSDGRPGMQSPVQCHQCPVGGDCSSGLGDVVALPGYWGGKAVSNGTTTVSFLPCPTGYCCLGEGTNWPCTAVDSCANNRTGVLCGECYPGHSESFGAAVCVPTAQCTDGGQFWGLGVVVVECMAIMLLLSTGLFRCGCVRTHKTGISVLTFYFIQVRLGEREEKEEGKESERDWARKR